MSTKTKKCRSCNRRLSVNEFYRNPSTRDRRLLKLQRVPQHVHWRQVQRRSGRPPTGDRASLPLVPPEPAPSQGARSCSGRKHSGREPRARRAESQPRTSPRRGNGASTGAPSAARTLARRAGISPSITRSRWSSAGLTSRGTSGRPAGRATPGSTGDGGGSKIGDEQLRWDKADVTRIGRKRTRSVAALGSRARSAPAVGSGPPARRKGDKRGRLQVLETSIGPLFRVGRQDRPALPATARTRLRPERE